jgi:hypothetical protein
MCVLPGAHVATECRRFLSKSWAHDWQVPYLVAPALAVGCLRTLRQPRLPVDGGLSLRPWRESDAATVRSAFECPDIQRWHIRRMDDLDEAGAWIADWSARWADETLGPSEQIRGPQQHRSATPPITAEPNAPDRERGQLGPCRRPRRTNRSDRAAKHLAVRGSRGRLLLDSARCPRSGRGRPGLAGGDPLVVWNTGPAPALPQALHRQRCILSGSDEGRIRGRGHATRVDVARRWLA